MISLRSPDPALPGRQEELTSPLAGIEHGLSFLAQGRLPEGLEILRDAALLLSSGESPLASALDALLEATGGFLHAQQRLYEASRRFAEAERKWQACVEALSSSLRAGHTPAWTASLPEDQLAHRILHLPSISPRTAFLSDASLPAPAEATDAPALPPLYINCFGRFTVRRLSADGPEIELCRNSRGQAILRYLLIQPERRATLDMLMADLWPEEDAQVARHKLQVAISALRCSLNRESLQTPGAGYILYRERMYQLNPALEFHTDVAEFSQLYQAGRQAESAAITAECYKQACRLYTGPFLGEDLYAEWSFLAREETARMYLAMCEWLANHSLVSNDYEATLAWVANILKIDRCNEEAYRLSMRALAALGRRSEARRCYQQCQRTLAEELGVQPMPETQRLLCAIMQGQ